MTEAGLTDDLLTEMIRKTAGSRPSDNSGSAQDLSPRAKHVLQIAMEDAIRGGYAYGNDRLRFGKTEAYTPWFEVRYGGHKPFNTAAVWSFGKYGHCLFLLAVK